MDRRKFLTGTAVAGVAVGATALLSGCGKKEPKKVAETKPAAPAVVTKKVKELKMVTSWPKGFPGLGTAADRLAKNLETVSDGRFKVKVFGGGELVPALKCNDAVQQGTADLYHSADYYYGGKSPAYLFFTTVPFGFTADEMNAWITHGGGQALWDETGAQFGIKHLAAGNTGVQMGGWFNKPIRSVEDFKGIKMRMPGLGGKVINAIGGTAVTLAGAEIKPAIDAGTIDATEWVGPWNDRAFGLYQKLKFYHYPGFHEPGSMLSLGISKKLWDGLSNTDKAMFTAVAGAENSYDLAAFNANNATALTDLVQNYGVKLIEFPDDLFKAFGEASKTVLAETGAKDPLTKKVYESFLAFRKNAVGWSRIGEEAYLVKRELVTF